jgi:hypothetical protein
MNLGIAPEIARASLQGFGPDAPGCIHLRAATIRMLADRIRRWEYAVVYRASFSN